MRADLIGDMAGVYPAGMVKNDADSQPMRQRLGIAWYAITVVTAIWGLVIVSLWWSGLTEPGGWWAIDSRRVIAASGVWLAGGDPYSLYGFVYSPLAVLAGLPFRFFGEWGWFAVEAFALVWIMLKASRGLEPTHRAFVVMTGFLFLPATSDLLLGNVTLVLLACALVAITSDRIGTGLAFGLALAAVPKPMFVPILLWMSRYRRRSLIGVLLAGLTASLVGIAVMGLDRYWAFFSTLASGANIPADFVGNNGLSAFSPELGLIGNIVGVCVVLLSIAFAPRDASLVIASIAGVFLGSYAGLYAALPLLISLPSFAPRHRGRALTIAALSNGLVVAMPLFSAAAMVAALAPFRQRGVQTSRFSSTTGYTEEPTQKEVLGPRSIVGDERSEPDKLAD